MAFCCHGIAEPLVFPVSRVLGWCCSAPPFYRHHLFLLKSRLIFKKRAMFKNQWIIRMRFGQSWPTTALHAMGSMIKGAKPIFDSIWNRSTQLPGILLPGGLVVRSSRAGPTRAKWFVGSIARIPTCSCPLHLSINPLRILKKRSCDAGSPKEHAMKSIGRFRSLSVLRCRFRKTTSTPK